jgi:hypothetical protein
MSDMPPSENLPKDAIAITERHFPSMLHCTAEGI